MLVEEMEETIMHFQFQMVVEQIPFQIQTMEEPTIKAEVAFLDLIPMAKTQEEIHNQSPLVEIHKQEMEVLIHRNQISDV